MTNFPPLTPDATPVPQTRDARLNLTDVRRLTMGEGGIIRTAASGQRIELTNEDRNFVYFYSGHTDEILAAKIEEYSNGSGTTETLQFALKAPYFNVNDQSVAIVMRSASGDGTTTPPGVVIAKTTLDDPGTGAGLDPVFSIQSGIDMETSGDIGLAAGGSVGFGTNYDDAIHQTADGTLEVEVGGTSVAAVNSFGIDATGGFTLPVKTTTGDPSGISTGYIYMNTFDKAIRAYDGATWRDVVTW